MASGGSVEAGTLGGDAGDQALRRANGGVEGLALSLKGLGGRSEIGVFDWLNGM